MSQLLSTPRTKLLEPEWIVAVQEAIEARHKNMNEVIDAYVMGQYDAEHGFPCEPTRYYAKLGDIESYIIAYNDTTAAWAAAVQEVNDALHPALDLDGELQALIDGMEDEAWIRGGCS